MAMQNITILMVLVSLGSYYSIQALVIRGVDIPALNTTKLAGKWFVVNEYIEAPVVECTTSLVIPLSDNSLMVVLTFRLLPTTGENNSSIVRSVTRNVTMTLDENIYIKGKDDNGEDYVEIALDVDYESHLVIFVASSVKELSDGKNGYIYIISRKPTLAKGVLEKAKESVFYKEGVKPGLSFIHLNATACA